MFAMRYTLTKLSVISLIVFLTVIFRVEVFRLGQCQTEVQSLKEGHWQFLGFGNGLQMRGVGEEPNKTDPCYPYGNMVANTWSGGRTGNQVQESRVVEGRK